MGFQWSYNGQPLAGANGATLTLPGVVPAQAGSYRVRVSSPRRSFRGQPGRAAGSGDRSRLDLGALSTEKLAELFADDPVGLGAAPAGRPQPSGSSRVSLGVPGTRVLSFAGSLSEPGDPVPCDVIVTAFRWLRLRATAPGTRIVLVTTNAAFDTVLAVFTNRFAPALVVCNDDLPTGLRNSRVTFPAAAGVDYLVMVAAKGWARSLWCRVAVGDRRRDGRRQPAGAGRRPGAGRPPSAASCSRAATSSTAAPPSTRWRPSGGFASALACSTFATPSPPPATPSSTGSTRPTDTRPGRFKNHRFPQKTRGHGSQPGPHSSFRPSVPVGPSMLERPVSRAGFPHTDIPHEERSRSIPRFGSTMIGRRRRSIPHSSVPADMRR